MFHFRLFHLRLGLHGRLDLRLLHLRLLHLGLLHLRLLLLLLSLGFLLFTDPLFFIFPHSAVFHLHLFALGRQIHIRILLYVIHCDLIQLRLEGVSLQGEHFVQDPVQLAGIVGKRVSDRPESER